MQPVLIFELNNMLYFQISFNSDWFVGLFSEGIILIVPQKHLQLARSHGTYIIKECISHTQSNYLISLMTIQTFKVNVLMCVYFERKQMI